MVTLTNEQANYDTLLNALYDVLIDSGQGDTIIFYFSGHGDCESALINQPGFLLTHDTPPHNYLIASLRIDDLKSMIASYVEGKESEVILFIDACRAGKLAERNTGGPSKTASLLLNLFEKEVLFLSCTPNQLSQEKSELNHGVFTYCLLKGLSGRADANHDNFLEVEELRRYLLDEVSEKTGRLQTPIASGDPLKIVLMCHEMEEGLVLKGNSKQFHRPMPFEQHFPPSAPNLQPTVENSLRLSPEEALKKFHRCIEKGNLVTPEEDCAIFYFQQYPSDSLHRKNKEKMLARLINELLRESGEILLKYIYEGHSSILPADCGKAIKELRVARSLIPPGHFLYRTIASRQLFLHGLAQHYVASPDWQSAIDSLKESVQIEPSAGYAYNELGIAASKLDNFQKAELYFDTAMALSPEWESPKINLQNIKMLAEEKSNRGKNKGFPPIYGGSRVIYVKKGGNGNGSSWEQALGNLQEALLRAKDGDNIWVASGKYFTTKDSDRTKSFVIPNGVTLVGGFAGYENSSVQRDPVNNLTILSGEIGQSFKDDNAYTVVYTKNASRGTLIDGFVIMGGSASGSASQNPLHHKGAGWFNDATNGNSSPSIRNCIFMENMAREGAGIYNYASNGTCIPSIENCKFIRNISEVDGGAVFNDGNNGSCKPQFVNCLFEANEATFGASMFNKADYGQAVPNIRNCVFVANVAYIRGSGVYNDRTASSKGVSDAIMNGCRFENNSSSVGTEINSRVSNFDFHQALDTKSSGG